MVQKGVDNMLQPKSMNWEKLFKQNPHRWLPVYDNQKHLIEVHDTETGNVWFEVDSERWMFIQ